MQYASSSPTVLSRPPFERIHAGVFSLGSPAPICENVLAHDVQRAKILIGDWQLRVPVAWRETTEPENGAGVGFFSRFFDYSLCPVQVEGCWDTRAIIDAMEH